MDYVHKIARQKPNLLVSIASDAWFGESGAPVHHLARATNTGVSAIVDALGRIKLEGPLVNAAKNSLQPPTLLTGDVSLMEIHTIGPYIIKFFPLICLLALLIAVVFSILLSKKRS